MSFKVELPMPEVHKGDCDEIYLSFIDGASAKIDGAERGGDRCISDWSSPSGYGYRRGAQDNLYTDEDFIKYVYEAWVDRMMYKMERAQSHLNLMYKYAVKPDEPK